MLDDFHFLVQLVYAVFIKYVNFILVQVLCKLWLFVHFLSQDDEDEDEDDKEGGLSKSGKELKKLLGRTGGLDDSDAEDDDDDDDDVGYLFIYLWDTQS